MLTSSGFEPPLRCLPSDPPVLLDCVFSLPWLHLPRQFRTDGQPGTKKCGHMGGKVLVSMQEHCDRLVAARLQADIMGTEVGQGHRYKQLPRRVQKTRLPSSRFRFVWTTLESPSSRRGRRMTLKAFFLIDRLVRSLGRWIWRLNRTMKHANPEAKPEVHA